MCLNRNMLAVQTVFNIFAFNNIIIMISSICYWSISCFHSFYVLFSCFKSRKTLSYFFPTHFQRVYIESETWWNHVWAMIIASVFHCKASNACFIIWCNTVKPHHILSNGMMTTMLFYWNRCIAETFLKWSNTGANGHFG